MDRKLSTEEVKEFVGELTDTLDELIWNAYLSGILDESEYDELKNKIEGKRRRDIKAGGIN